MGFHALGSLSEGCHGEQSEVVTDCSGDASTDGERELMPSFRMAAHPAAALEESIPSRRSCSRYPFSNVHAQTTETAVIRLQNLSLGDSPLDSDWSTQSWENGRCHVIPLHVDSGSTTNSGSRRFHTPVCGEIRKHCRERSPSPTPSVASTQSTTSTLSTVSSLAANNPRTRFLVFIKILFKCLDQANEPEFRDRAKEIVAECTRRNRMGDPKFTPLVEAVEKRLRAFVGETHWKKASILLRAFAAKQSECSSRRSMSHDDDCPTK